MVQAVQECGEVDIFTANFRPLKATLSGLPDWVFMKLIVCANTNTVLGVHMCGEDSPEIIQVSLFCFNSIPLYLLAFSLAGLNFIYFRGLL